MKQPMVKNILGGELMEQPMVQNMWGTAWWAPTSEREKAGWALDQGRPEPAVSEKKQQKARQ